MIVNKIFIKILSKGSDIMENRQNSTNINWDIPTNVKPSANP